MLTILPMEKLPSDRGDNTSLNISNRVRSFLELLLASLAHLRSSRAANSRRCHFHMRTESPSRPTPYPHDLAGKSSGLFSAGKEVG